MIRKLWQRLHAELALLRAEHERRKQVSYKRALHKRRVVIMDAPKPDERSSIGMHQRIVGGKQ